VVAALALFLLILYPWFGCTIDRSQVEVSLKKGWAVSRPDGSAVGLVLNITNHGGCDLHLAGMSVTVHKVTYRSGLVEDLEFTETQEISSTISPGRTENVDFTFDYIFRGTPVELTLRVEMSFREVGMVSAFDGELPMPFGAQ